MSFCNEVAGVLGFVHCSDHAQSHGASRKRNLRLSTSEKVTTGDQRPVGEEGEEEAAAVVGEIRGEQSIC